MSKQVVVLFVIAMISLVGINQSQLYAKNIMALINTVQENERATTYSGLAKVGITEVKILNQPSMKPLMIDGAITQLSGTLLQKSASNPKKIQYVPSFKGSAYFHAINKESLRSMNLGKNITVLIGTASIGSVKGENSKPILYYFEAERMELWGQE